MISISSQHLTLECHPETGGSISALQFGGVDVFRPYDASLALSPLNMASFPLVPYSNRIINGVMRFGGEDIAVGPRTAPGPHQLHGDGWVMPWRVEAQGESHVALALEAPKRAETPYAYAARQVYTLSPDTLTIDMSVTNRAGRALPFGLGHHPYFPRNDRTTLKASLPKVWESRRIVPERLADTPPVWDFSRGIRMADAHFMPPAQGTEGLDLLDHCFAGWDGRAEIIWPDQGMTLEMTADKVFGAFVIYIPQDKPFFCAEPVTHVNDAFNLMARGVADTGAVVLADGETLSGSMRFRVHEA